MITYTRLYDGKVYTSYEDCENDNTFCVDHNSDEPLIEVQASSENVTVIDSDIAPSKHKKIKQLFKLGG